MTTAGWHQPVAHRCLEHTFTLKFFTRELARAAYGLCLFTGAFHGRFFVMLPEFHFPEHTFTLKLFLQSPEGLIDVVIANLYLHL